MAKKYFDARGLDCYGARTIGLLEELQTKRGVKPYALDYFQFTPTRDGVSV